MNVAVHQELEKNEETKMSKRKTGERRRHVTDFNEAVCCPSAVIQGAAQQKMVCARGVPRVTGSLGKANSHFDVTQMGSGTAPHHVEVAVDCCLVNSLHNTKQHLTGFLII